MDQEETEPGEELAAGHLLGGGSLDLAQIRESNQYRLRSLDETYKAEFEGKRKSLAAAASIAKYAGARKSVRFEHE